MYNQEIVAEMNYKHRELLGRYHNLLEPLDALLTEQPFPQNLLQHAVLHLAGSFYTSALALRLLLVSGYCEEAYGVLLRMAEYAWILKGMPDQPEETVMCWIEEGGRRPDRMLREMTDKAYLPEEFNAVCRTCSSSKSPQPCTDVEELMLPAGPAPFNAEDLLEQACCLAAAMQGYVQI